MACNPHGLLLVPLISCWQHKHHLGTAIWKEGRLQVNLVISGEDTKLTDAGMPWPQPHHCSCRTKVKFNNQRKNWEGFSGNSDQLCSNSSADSKKQESPPQPEHSGAALRPVKISKHQSPLYNMEMTQLKTSIGSLVRTGHLLPSLLWITDITRNEKTDCFKVIKQALTPRTYHTVLRHVHNPHHGQEKPQESSLCLLVTSRSGESDTTTT